MVSCKFNTVIYDRMYDLIDKSIAEGREYSIKLCKKNGVLSYSKECSGQLCEIPIERILGLKCPRGFSFFGNFHTHPAGTRTKYVEHSDFDLTFAATSQMRILCIGSHYVTFDKRHGQYVATCYEIPEKLLKIGRQYNKAKNKLFKIITESIGDWTSSVDSKDILPKYKKDFDKYSKIYNDAPWDIIYNKKQVERCLHILWK